MDVTVLIPSIPERTEMLNVALASVAAQSEPPEAVLVQVSVSKGPPMAHLVEQRNQMLGAATSEWVATLDDDDAYLPHHFATVAEALADADVIYTQARNLEFWPDVSEFPQAEVVARLRNGNCFPSNACIRRSTLLTVGGWSVQGWDPVSHLYPDGVVWAEDWHLWLRLAQAGARFVGLPTATWVLGQHDAQMTKEAKTSMGLT